MGILLPDSSRNDAEVCAPSGKGEAVFETLVFAEQTRPFHARNTRLFDRQTARHGQSTRRRASPWGRTPRIVSRVAV